MWDRARNLRGSDSTTQKHKKCKQTQALRGHCGQRPSTQHAPGERAGLGAQNSSPGVSWSREARGGGGGSAGTQPAPLAFTYILASWSLGAGKPRRASRSLKKKKTSPNT